MNKLGDLEKAVPNCIVYGIRKLLINRTSLKTQVVDTVTEFIFRSDINPKVIDIHFKNWVGIVWNFLFTHARFTMYEKYKPSGTYI